MGIEQKLAIAACVAVLTGIGYQCFPGHAWLHQDTQIYLPILERLRDPSLFPGDPVALRPHVAYTIYDEMTLVLRNVLGGFHAALVLQQLLFRALGLFGASLLARAAQLSWRMSLLVASLYGLGAFITGPSVLTLEYEPVPRGFAGPLLMLAAGLAAHSRWVWAGAACGAAFLYHAPAALPFCLVFGLMIVFPQEGRAGRIRGLLPIVASIAIVLVISRFQMGASEPQQFFKVVDDELAKLQQLRGSYNWVSLWNAQWIRNFEFLYLVTLAAWYRLRESASAPLRYLLAGLPLFGLLSIPLSYLLLEVLRWSLIPQVQPARATLFIVTMAVVGGGICGVRAAQQGRRWESVVWFMIAFAMPVERDVLQLLLPDLRQWLIVKRFLIVLGLSATAMLASRWQARRPSLSWTAWGACLLLPCYLFPGPGQVRNYPVLAHTELNQLASWAKDNTAKEAVFLFPDQGKELLPGMFRAHSLRAIYTDWKSGGQVNLLPGFAFEWWTRWQKTMEGKFEADKLDRYRGLGIHYLVLKKANPLPGRVPVYANAKYFVYRWE
ncbi:MAG: hypothetical protein JJE04_06350 [Acidobacteriia bacterium]|nr:hypothetical protein [Terriglobia bacterium]